jgi:hypothetical protein
MEKGENHHLNKSYGSNHPDKWILLVTYGDGVKFFLIFYMNRVYLKTKKGE